MQLTISDVSKMFDVPEAKIYRWIKERYIPVHAIGDEFRFYKTELMEWASQKGLRIAASFTSEDEGLPALIDCLKAGGVYYDVEGDNLEEVIAQVISMLTLPDDIDREFLMEVIVAREAIGSTNLGNGIAIPHVRNPIIMGAMEPTVGLFFLKNDAAFQVSDETPVTTLFLLITPSPRVHLHLLSRLGHCLSNDAFRSAVMHRASSEEIFTALEKAETE